MKHKGRAVFGALVSVLALSGAASALTVGPAGAAPSATPGVTKSTIRIGVSMINLSTVTQFTHGLTQGNFRGAYSALIDNVNQHGGIEGRKLAATFVNPDPLQSSTAAAACTQLTEDDHVFAVIGEFYSTDPECYVETHSTPVVGGTQTTATLSAARAPWFTTAPNQDVLEPAAVAAAAKAGVFKGKTVGVLSAADANPGVLSGVMSTLRKAGVKPKVSATVVNTTDSEAIFQQVSGVLAPKFQSDGVNVLVALGGASTTWVDATGAGTYHPLLVGTYYPDMEAAISGNAKANPVVVKNAVTSYLQPVANNGKAVGWADPSLQKCASIIRSAGVRFTNPVTNKKTSDASYAAVTQSCGVMALFEAILKKAGRKLTTASFAAAADTLGSVEIPGLGTATYDKAHPAGSFPLYLYRWSTAKQAWTVGSRSFGST